MHTNHTKRDGYDFPSDTRKEAILDVIPSRFGKTQFQRVLVGFLLLLHGTLLGFGAARHSFSYTEAGLLPSGVLSWRTGSFEYFRVNPPLLRCFAALPVLLMNPTLQIPEKNLGPTWRVEWELARNLVSNNGSQSLWMLAIARWTCIPISIWGAWLCYRWAHELFGIRAGFLALILWVFSPELLAHGQMISGDSAATVFGLATYYSLWRWLQTPRLWTSLRTGLMLGVAVSIKMTWLVSFFIIPTIWGVYRLTGKKEKSHLNTCLEVLLMAAIFFIAILIVNSCYGFSNSFRPLGEFEFLSSMLTGLNVEQGGIVTNNRFRATFLENILVPLPKDFLIGLDLQKWDLERPRQSYVDGSWYEHGFFAYYLYAAVLKMPIGNWVLIVLLLSSMRLPRMNCPADIYLLTIPIIFVFLLASSQTGLSKHSRYMLPVFPFLYVLISRVATIDQSVGTHRIMIGFPLVWSIASSLCIFPHSLSYFNESTGGPSFGYLYLNSSNIHWGEDLTYLKSWYEKNPKCRPLYCIAKTEAVTQNMC